MNERTKIRWVREYLLTCLDKMLTGLDLHPRAPTRRGKTKLSRLTSEGDVALDLLDVVGGDTLV